MSLNEFISKLTPSDIIQILGIIASFLTAFVAIVISLVTMRQNSKMIEESSRAIISIYPQSINTGTPMLFMVIKNFGKSPAIIVNLIMIMILPIVTDIARNEII